MLYRNLGKTGIRASAIGLGTWNIGNQWGHIEEEGAIATVRSAVEKGINLIDTAESYGMPAGLSEERVGKALEGRRDRVHIVTKMGRWGRRSGQMVPITTTDMVRLCAHASLYRLKTDYIDVMLCHEGKLADPQLAETYLEGFELLQQQGLIGTYGISTDRLDVLKLFNASDRCSVVEVDYSLLSRNPDQEFLPYCQAHNIAVLVRGSLHKGLLSGKYSADTVFTDTVRSEWYKDDRAKAKLARKLAKVDSLKAAVQPGEEMVKAALGFVISHPIAPVAIAGAKSPEQVSINASAGEKLMSPAERDYLIRCTKKDKNLAIA
ncbi:oxidoreductase, aldo/keto reductase family [Synechococcus sp. PCC 7335]|uniref:aldo/keto reductase n=1 Tax=Synechococcus sp. (strain ATCC 29403 / PCC 7335) TaxID=91464 RepID=UPI00017EDC67|nr:aldo/keto reductase [Synechococcus sp. PCC 7335]EDX84399.1 oxidoreductase, aldo/keto reductase family [Synechococcus sp. PCC 7335]